MTDSKDTRENWYTTPEVRKLAAMLAEREAWPQGLARPNKSLMLRRLVIKAAREAFGDQAVDQVLRTEVSGIRQ